MVCNSCENKKEFTMVKETGYWDDTDKMFKDTDGFGDEYIVCNECHSVKIDNEGDY